MTERAELGVDGNRMECVTVNEWQPIVTPPTDFAPVLVFVPSSLAGGIQEEPDMIHVAFLKRGAYYLQDDGYSIVKPTHWMPLPPPPRT